MFDLKVDTQRFLAENWQKKPCVIRGALPGFCDPIDEHDLAGLAQEDEIDSRIVAANKGEWQVHHGPFEQFDDVCKGQWTLMVQGVDKWVEEVSQLANGFSFIPYWRFDDVMISYAVEGAGVGPHVDQYDVFLLQGKGQRSWQVGAPIPSNIESKAIRPHKDLSQVAPFPALIDVVLNPGDILYIPPGWPHCGKSIQKSLTYSIGFRAPNVSDLVSPLLDSVDNCTNHERYTDQSRSHQSNSNLVSTEDIDKVTALLNDHLQSQHWQASLMCFLSNQHLPVDAPESQVDVFEVEHLFDTNAALSTVNGCRPLYCESIADVLFINGENYPSNRCVREWLISLFTHNCQQSLPAEPSDKMAIFQIVTTLINKGLVIID